MVADVVSGAEREREIETDRQTYIQIGVFPSCQAYRTPELVTAYRRLQDDLADSSGQPLPPTKKALPLVKSSRAFKALPLSGPSNAPPLY